jgi:hypothetical protein
MQVAAVNSSRAAVWALALLSLTLGAPPLAADDSAAHALAEKFSRAAEDSERAQAANKAAKVKKEKEERARAVANAEAARRKAAEQRAADEADMLPRARAEAKARQTDEQRAAEEQAPERSAKRARRG